MISHTPVPGDLHLKGNIILNQIRKARVRRSRLILKSDLPDAERLQVYVNEIIRATQLSGLFLAKPETEGVKVLPVSPRRRSRLQNTSRSRRQSPRWI